MNLPDASGWASQAKRIITEICDRPGHREQWAILLCGLALFPCVVAMVALLVWFGTHAAVAAALVIPIFGNITYGILTLMGLVIASMLGIVRRIGRINATLPGGAQIGLDMNGGGDAEEPPH